MSGDGRPRDEGARGIAAERGWGRKNSSAKGGSAEGETRRIIHKEPVGLTDSGRDPGDWTRTAERSTPVLLERAGEIAVKKKAMTEASDAASTESSSRKGESNNP